MYELSMWVSFTTMIAICQFCLLYLLIKHLHLKMNKNFIYFNVISWNFQKIQQVHLPTQVYDIWNNLENVQPVTLQSFVDFSPIVVSPVSDFGIERYIVYIYMMDNWISVILTLSVNLHNEFCRENSGYCKVVPHYICMTILKISWRLWWIIMMKNKWKSTLVSSIFIKSPNNLKDVT